MLTELRVHLDGVFAEYHNNIWFQPSEDNWPSALCYINLKSKELHKSDLVYSGRLWMHDGWFYWFDGEEFDSQLKRTNVKGHTETLLEMYYSPHHWPQMSFGSEGMVIYEDLSARVGAGPSKHWYIPFDGSGAEILDLSK